MVREYVTALYVPAAAASRELSDAEGFGPARELAAWKQRVVENWPQVRIEHVESEAAGTLGQRLGSALMVRVSVALGELTRDDVAVEVVYGRPDEDDEIVAARLRHAGRRAPGAPSHHRAPSHRVPPAAATAPQAAARPPKPPPRPPREWCATRVRCRWTGRGRSATRCACCRPIRCWTAGPSSAW